MSQPRGYTAKDVATLNTNKSVGVTALLDAINTVDVVRLGDAASKITYQRSGTLECTVEISLNGVDWTAITAVSTSAITSYDTHVVSTVPVTRTAGEGKLTVLSAR